MARLARRSPGHFLAALCARPVTGFLFQRGYDVFKSFDVGGAYPLHNGSFQIGQMVADALGQLSPLRCQHDEKRAAISFPDLARDQAPVSEAVENTGQCRSFVREATMEVGHSRRPGMRKQRQDVRFALRQSAFAQVIQVKTDPVCRPMNWMNKMQWHR